MARTAIITDVADINNLVQEFIQENRKGVIELPVPVLNINEWKNSQPAAYPEILGLNSEEFERIVYSSDLVVIESENDQFKEGAVLAGGSEKFKAYEQLSLEKKAKVKVAGGAEAIRYLFEHTDISKKFSEYREIERECMAKLEPLYDVYDSPEMEGLREQLFDKQQEAMESGSDSDPEYMTAEEHRLAEIEKEIKELSIRLSDVRTVLDTIIRYRKEGKYNLFIDKLTLFPAELKGILRQAMESDPYSIDDIEIFYKRIILRANRVRKLIEINAPAIIMRNEKRMLQEYVDTLIANGCRGKAIMKSNNNAASPLVSLSDLILKNTKIF